MVNITITYPIEEGNWFDMNYYLGHHVVLSTSIFGDVLKGITIEKCERKGSGSDELVCYAVIGRLFFENTDDFYNRYLPKKDILEKDLLNYTDVKPIAQISNIVYWKTPWVIEGE